MLAEETETDRKGKVTPASPGSMGLLQSFLFHLPLGILGMHAYVSSMSFKLPDPGTEPCSTT